MVFDPKNVKKQLANHILADGFDPIIDLKKSHGSYLVDQRNDDEYLDMFSMYASGRYLRQQENFQGENYSAIHCTIIGGQ